MRGSLLLGEFSIIHAESSEINFNNINLSKLDLNLLYSQKYIIMEKVI